MHTEHHQFRWKAEYGKPQTIGEHILQFLWTYRLLIYIAIISTATLIFQVFHIDLI